MKDAVRLATVADSSGINDISTYLGYVNLSGDEAEDKLCQLIASAQDEVYVSELGGDIVGWLHLFYARRLASASFYEIGGLVVNPDFRGQGIGRDLVNHALEAHSEKIRVRCSESRLEAHAFYEAINFHKTKVQHVFQTSS